MSEVREINIDEIEINPHQPRVFFDRDAIEELAVSIKENGLVQPLTVREKGNHYELIAGERRLRACKYLEYTKVPAYIVSSSDSQSMYMALIENVQREDLSSIEEAKAYLRIMQLNNMTQGELSDKIGKSQPSIANKIRLLNLDVNVQNAIESKLISERHARALLSLDSEKQNEVLSKIIKNKWTVAQTENAVKSTSMKNQKEKSIQKGYSRNVQIGVNTIKKACEMVEKSGLQISFDEKESAEDVIIEIRIKK
ncbi:ParB family chromosome partitioning protein [Breznakia sp. PF5-3]|uniref:ParB/RepB/Spo0J family partition protein n=1 Tax=unclassified Breznakia TaxID=2623764 RepID=UPI002407030C|nr:MULTISPECIES: ParB/RepB/Spo0J family partition protein [unclassified Breznakia]MDF9825680.1 ParB family chromosome partitioning protein [Breznakia sp. PM6-1]MDF9836509.1 ParB family chromosome partitioning protein [Breznakia sp. PF5-3]MDF9837812.1 ParB family chromosome partitioning protein [Breznakia sp. PFB2-8]MDF9859732.1 ParB family chromosome partitioning protein [Breznakia sp. PH5-24]